MSATCWGPVLICIHCYTGPCGVGDYPCLVPTIGDPGETSGPRIDRIPSTRPPWWRRQYRDLKKLLFLAPSKCPIDLFGPVANRTIPRRLLVAFTKSLNDGSRKLIQTKRVSLLRGIQFLLRGREGRIDDVHRVLRTMTKDPISQLNRPRPRAAEHVVLAASTSINGS